MFLGFDYNTGWAKRLLGAIHVSLNPSWLLNMHDLTMCFHLPHKGQFSIYDSINTSVRYTTCLILLRGLKPLQTECFHQKTSNLHLLFRDVNICNTQSATASLSSTKNVWPTVLFIFVIWLVLFLFIFW